VSLFLNNKSLPISISSSNEPEYKEVSIMVRDNSNENLMANVDVEISSDGPPEFKKTDANGYVEIKIPTRKTVEIRLIQKDYNSERYMVNLQNDPKTTKTFYMEPKKDNLPESSSSPAATEAPAPGISSPPTATLPGIDSSKNSSNLMGTGTLPTKYFGKWAGNIIYSNLRTNSPQKNQTNVVFSGGKVGSKVASFYGNSCWRSLILKDVKSTSVELFENITGGYAGNCDSGGVITIKLLGDDLMVFKGSPPPGSSMTASGTLTRQ
jgi:hypothetical protein